jgi:L-threonylcarbamoyladenylate synthase
MSISQLVRIPKARGKDQRSVIGWLSRLLLDGGVMAYPTETVYGLGCLAYSERSVERICTLKGSGSGRPFILLIPSSEWLERLVRFGETTSALSRSFWPGPLTLVLEALDEIPDYLLGEDRTIALRHSSSEFVQSLFEEVDQPLISTSANPEGFPPAESSLDVRQYFEEHEQVIDALVEFPEIMTGRASTVVSLVGEKVSILREGPISEEEVLNTLEHIK